jgi:AAA domain
VAWLPGKVTALTSQTKSGKTTLASLLFVRLQAGGQLAGLAVAPGRSLVVSEESKLDWDARCRHLGLTQNIQFVCRPFKGARPTTAQWSSLIAHVESVHRREALDLVMIDPLATFLPGHAENSPQQLLDCLLPLQELATRGPAVCLLHHTGKGKRADGQAARGTSALGGFVDILIEMSHFKRARSKDRRRRLCAYSRYEQTPRHLVIELNADGTDYLVRTDAAGAVLVANWPEVHSILATATEKLGQQTILERWPEDGDPPSRATLLRWLTRATRQGLICRAGSGHRGDSYRYWLAEREPLLWPGDWASEAEKQAWRDRRAAWYAANTTESERVARPLG